jgi:hypothetical protein
MLAPGISSWTGHSSNLIRDIPFSGQTWFTPMRYPCAIVSKFVILRSNLVLPRKLYYFALVRAFQVKKIIILTTQKISQISNVLIRFIWVLYIPLRGPNITLRTFIGAILEMLRRWQWNIYRLENEHLGNMDQYRVTREVPLPYRFDETAQEEEDGDEDVVSRRRWLHPQRTRSTNLKTVSAHGDETHIG